MATALNNLGPSLQAQGRYAEAEPLYKRSARHPWRRRWGPTIPTSPSPSATSPRSIEAQGRYAEAEPLDRRALAIREKALGPDHADVARSLNNLGSLHETLGRYAEAEPLYKRSLAVLRRRWGQTTPMWALSLNNLGRALSSAGPLRRGRAPLQARPRHQREGVGSRAPRCRRRRSTISPCCIICKGRYVEADPLYQRALAILEKSWAATIPLSQPPSTTSPCSIRPRATTPMPSPSPSARSPSGKRRWDPATPAWPSRSTISPSCTARSASMPRPSRSTGAR